MNSQQKGKRKEREIAKIIAKKFDVQCRRTPCSGALDFKGDIVSLQGVAAEYHWEIKNQEKLNIWSALNQAIRDARPGKTPVVVFSKAFSDNYVALRFDDFINMIKEIEDLRT